MNRGGSHVTPRWKRIICEFWAICYAAALFFALLQMLLMSDSWWFAIPLLAAPPAVYLGLRAVFRAHMRGRLAPRIIMLLIAAAHLILPLRQLFGSVEPNVDSVILAAFAFLILLSAIPLRIGQLSSAD
jgi:hypothetical protein